MHEGLIEITARIIASLILIRAVITNKKTNMEKPVTSKKLNSEEAKKIDSKIR